MNVLHPSRARFVIALLLPVLALLATVAPAAAQDDYYTLPIPCRYDSRVPSSVPPGPFGAGGPAKVVPFSSFLGCTIPANADALVVSVVGINPSASGELIVFPDAIPTIEPVIPGQPPVARIPGSLPMEQGKNRAKIFTVKVGPGPAIRFVGIFPVEAGFHVEINVLGYFLNNTTVVDDATTVNEDASATTIDVLANDTDPDDALTIASVTQPANGTVVITNAGADLTYLPDANYCNSEDDPVVPDTFTYTTNTEKTGTVDVTVTCVNDNPVAVDDAATVAEDAPATTINVLTNDTDVENDSFTIASATDPTNGTVVVAGDGLSLTYQPDANYCGADTFDYTLTPGGDTATVTITVTCVEGAPVAVDDVATVAEDAAATPIDVLANDTDDEGDSFTIASATDPANGTVVLTGGSPGAHTGLTYEPDDNFCGSDTFNYTLNPGGDEGSVTVTVTCENDNPVAVDDAATVTEDDPATAINVLANDTDAESDAFTIASATDPANGAVVLTGGSPGAHTGLTYQPDANFCGSDTFNYTLNPGGDTATVTVTVTCVNDDPVAVDDAATVAEDASATTINVLANDTDAESDAFTIASATDPANGTVVLTGGSPGAHTGLTYQPDANYCGSDTFNYTLNPGGDVGTVVVTVTCVNDNPVAVDDAATVTEDDPATAINVLANDTDVESDAFTIASVTDPANGTVVPTGGSPGAHTGLTYQPDANYCGSDTFNYTLNPGGDVGTVVVTVTCVNDNPVAVDDAAIVAEDDPATAINVLGNDTDVESDAFTIASATDPANGTVVLTGGSPGAHTGLTYQPDANYCGSDTFNYTLNPGGDIGTVVVTVTCVDDSPVAVDDAATVTEDDPATAINVLANDTDIDAGPKAIASATAPASGTVVLTGGSPGAYTGLTYQPTANFCGSDTFNYTLTPGGDIGTVVVTVTCVPDPPVAGTDNFETFGNTELRVDLAAAATPHVLTDLTGASGVLNNDSDPIEMTPISITNVVGCGDVTAPFVCATASGGQVTLESDGSFSYLPPQANPAVTATDSSDSFQYTLTNGVGASAIGTVNLTRREVIWYVDSTAAAGGDGRSHSPFQSFASLNGVAGAGDLDNADDYILVHDGSFSGSVELEAGQRLIGQGVGLSLNLGSLGLKEILPATTHPQITNASGDVIRVTSAVPARIAGLSLSGSVNAIDMQTTGAYSGSGTLAIENNTFRGAGAEGIDVNAGATGTVALNIQNNTWDVAGTHVGNAIDIATTNGALRLDISGNTNVLSTGASAIVAGAALPGTLTITGFAGNSIHGNSALAGASISQATFDSNLALGGFQQVDGDNMSIGAAGNPVGSTGLSLTSVQGNLFFDDLDIYSGSGAGLQTSGTGSGMSFSVTPASPDGSGTSWIDADNGPAVDLSNIAVDLRLARLESATTTSGLVLSGVSGQLRAPSGSSIAKSSGGGTAFSVSSSSATVDYAGSLNITSGAGVALSGNTGSTNFSGGMLLSTGTNTAFSATGGGTVTVVDPPGLTNNTVTTTTGTALNISGTTIGGGGVTFESVTSTTAGANTAIILANTGSGPFLVAGTGSSGTGGTISNKSVDAMTVNNTDGSVTLRNMIIQDIGDLGGGLHTISGDDAIHAQQVDGGLTLENVIIRRISDQAIHGSLFAGGATVWNGLTITNSTIEDTNRFNVANTGDANNEGMIRILGIRGNVSITGSTLQRGGELIDFFVTDGTLNMTASANDFHTAYKEFTSGVTASVGGHCVDVTVQGAANADVRIGDRTDSGLANDFLNCRLGSVRVANDSGATGSVDVVIGRNTFTVNDHSSGIGGDFDFPQGGVLLMSRGTDTATFDVVIDGNYFDEITNASGGVGQVSYDMQNGSWQVLMEDNTFDTPGNAPWYLRADSTASARVLFRNNLGIKGFFNCPDASCAGGYDGPGLRSLADLQNGALMDLTIIGDQFAEHDASFDPGQTFEARVLNTGGGGTLCLDLQNNRAPDGYSLEEFAGDLNLVGSGSCPAGTPSAGCQTLLGAKGNLGGSNVATTNPPFVNVAGTIDVVAAACQQPAGGIF